jgi:signal transduction histidine kinase
LSRVLGNMLKNGLEAVQQGERVTIGCRPGDRKAEFWVHNPGVMSENVRLQVFQRSFSTKGTGRGLGTYSIKLLTERYLRGQVSFRSGEGEGTTFMACYPL